MGEKNRTLAPEGAGGGNRAGGGAAAVASEPRGRPPSMLFQKVRTNVRPRGEAMDGPLFEPGEAELWLRWRRRGCRNARDRLFELHGEWAFRRARHFALSRGFDPRQVLGGVAVALLDSIARFDPARGACFQAFAGPRVSGALRDAGRELYGRGARAGRGDAHDARGASSQTPPAGWQGRLARRRVTPARVAGRELSPGPVPSGFGGCARVTGGPDPLAVAEERETRALLLDAMPDGRAREVARRRFWLGESVDEIGLALGLGKTVVAECLSRQVLPAAKRLLRRIGLAPGAPGGPVTSAPRCARVTSGPGAGRARSRTP